MELKEQPFTPTLAYKLGEVSHVSWLLQRLSQLVRSGKQVADCLAPPRNHWLRPDNQTVSHA